MELFTVNLFLSSWNHFIYICKLSKYGLLNILIKIRLIPEIVSWIIWILKDFDEHSFSETAISDHWIVPHYRRPLGIIMCIYNISQSCKRLFEMKIFQIPIWIFINWMWYIVIKDNILWYNVSNILVNE